MARTRGPRREAHAAPGALGPAGLLLVVLLGLSAGPRPAWAGAALPFPPLHWKALLLAGDDSIGAFDHAIEALATLFQQHHITVVQQFSANPSKLSATVRLATVAELRAAIPLLQVQSGEGCLLYATSHGTREGLILARDAASGYRLPNGQNIRIHLFARGYGQLLIQRACDYHSTFMYNVN